MSDLAEFLLARIAEDEGAVGHPTLDLDQNPRWGITNTEYFDARVGRDRWLADCATKRRIIEWARERELVHPEATSTTGDEAVYITYAGYPRALELLALPYADHPDYRDEWRP